MARSQVSLAILRAAEALGVPLGPTAYAVMGRLASSPVLTLVFLPALYVVFSDSYVA
jgi:multidrug efflux pump subunit AcrB